MLRRREFPQRTCRGSHKYTRARQGDWLNTRAAARSLSLLSRQLFLAMPPQNVEADKSRASLPPTCGFQEIAPRFLSTEKQRRMSGLAESWQQQQASPRSPRSANPTRLLHGLLRQHVGHGLQVSHAMRQPDGQLPVQERRDLNCQATRRRRTSARTKGDGVGRWCTFSKSMPWGKTGVQ